MTPEERAQRLIPLDAARIYVDTPDGNRKIYLPGDWADEVAAHIRAAVAEEREACAQAANVGAMGLNGRRIDYTDDIVARIRARTT